MLPQLRKLEHRFHDEIVVVGVHSPKFSAEKETENLRQACLRLGIDHPVVSDPTMRMWSEYGVRAWPTLVFVDPAGSVIGKHEGEIRADDFEPVLTSMIEELDARELMDRRHIGFAPALTPATPLLFPGNVLADARSESLVIADSGHNRIVVTGLDGHVRLVIGTGERALRDGAPDEAAFHLPQGLTRDGETLYVADTWNHAVRSVDLRTGRVRTLAGTGRLGTRVKEGPGLGMDLRSPWGIVMSGGRLYLSMAGTHNLWTVDQHTGLMAKYAGSGREALVDGPLERATFAQPSGLSAGSAAIYVADSETSSVRVVDLPDRGGQVRTLVGEGLFDYGDIDGLGKKVRLQHVLDVAYDPTEATLYVADSYNNRIKRMDPETTQTVSILGNGSPAWLDGTGQDSAFWEPGGLSILDGKLYVADTNNHAIRVVELATLEVSTLELDGLATP